MNRIVKRISSKKNGGSKKKGSSMNKSVKMHKTSNVSRGNSGSLDVVDDVVISEEVALQIHQEEWYGQPLSVVVFGASGDLAKKKTYPALFALYKDNSLPKDSIICGYARSEKTDPDFRKSLRPWLLKYGQAKKVDEFLKFCIYRRGQYDSADDVKKVDKELETMHKNSSPHQSVENRVFYLALPPGAFVSSCHSVKAGGMSSTGFNRVIVEKPFGHDLESAQELKIDLGEVFSEDYLYRIDHYLGKEMVQNLIILRFGNAFLEPIWNRNFVSSVIVSFKEDIGTMGRGGYFDTSGIIRDVMQNHLMQVLSIIAMEPPIKVAGEGYSDYVRDEKVKVLKCIEPWSLDNVVLGQYTSNGKEPGYLDDETVPEGSNCPTFCTAVMYVNNSRWDGVPFIMKAGKALDNRRAEIRLQLKNPPGAASMFDGQDVPLNELVIRLQPNEAIYMKTNVKKPGLHTALFQGELDLSYESRFSTHEIHDAYTRLVLDVLRGKQATFVRDDELMEAWKIVTPLLKQIDEHGVNPIPYQFGSRGPPESDELVKKAGYVRNSEYAEEWNSFQNISRGKI